MKRIFEQRTFSDRLYDFSKGNIPLTEFLRLNRQFYDCTSISKRDI